MQKGHTLCKIKGSGYIAGKKKKRKGKQKKIENNKKRLTQSVNV
jgi:hypothetical protein